MSIVSVHIRHKCLPLLPWNIIQGFSEACTLLELITAIKNGTLGPVDWTFPEKLTTCDVSATIGRNKIESFNKVMMSMNIGQTTTLLCHYIKLERKQEAERSLNEKFYTFSYFSTTKKEEKMPPSLINFDIKGPENQVINFAWPYKGIFLKGRLFSLFQGR
jgi:hypothetical protein